MCICRDALRDAAPGRGMGSGSGYRRYMYHTHRRLCHSIPLQSLTLKGRHVPWPPVFRFLSLVDRCYVHLVGQGLWPIATDLCLYATTQTANTHTYIHSPGGGSNPRSPSPDCRKQCVLWTAERYTTSAEGTASSDSGVINLFLTMRPDYLDTFYSLFTRAC